MATPANPENRLSREKSPYLLQHAENPVNWFAWGEEAFQKASRENKPVLLSIGYSTCHWCHVMAHESFEDEATAKILNDFYVSVKVDREERPDIDHIYMDYVQATIGRGGWPMTVFLSPDKSPFYGGTYFPPEDRYGMPGFKTLLLSIADAWKTRPDEIKHSAQSAVLFLRQKSEAESRLLPLTHKVLDEAFGTLRDRFDAANGGFSHAPKFPSGHTLSFLMGYWKKTARPEALSMTEHTLKAMARGGLYDQLGGGFHRYSTDAVWRVPHFEKMLYDQALLVKAYLQAYQITKDSFYRRIAEETLDYVESRMTDREGGFFSAEDADSLEPDGKEKREGAYYVWTKNEIENILGRQNAEIFMHHYGVEENGNALSDPHDEFRGKNILHLAYPDEDTAEKFRLSAAQLTELLSASKMKLLKRRDTRHRPHLDDKIMTDWNGLMITAFAMAAQQLDNDRYLKTAQNAAAFILKRLKKSKGRLLHRYRDGEASIDGHLDDYAFFTQALLTLYQADFNEQWLAQAAELTDGMLELFADSEKGGFFFVSKLSEDLIARPKIAYDGAIPSGNSIAAINLFCLSRLKPDSAYGAQADRALQAFSGEITDSPSAVTQMLQALSFALGPAYEIVISAEDRAAAVSAFLKEIHSHFIPDKVLLLNQAGPAGEPIRKFAPFLNEKTPLSGKTAVYVCRNFACELPATDTAKLREILLSKA